jgi:hypothetical protein
LRMRGRWYYHEVTFINDIADIGGCDGAGVLF